MDSRNPVRCRRHSWLCRSLRPEPPRPATQRPAAPRAAAAAREGLSRHSNRRERTTRASAAQVEVRGDAAQEEAASRNTLVSDRYREFLDQWDKGFFTYQEHPLGYPLEVTEGTLPPEICGTYYRNGPGRFEIGSETVQHPYDGDGLVVSISLRGGRAYLRSRFVDTPEAAVEARAGRVMFRNSFATQKSGGVLANLLDMYIKNTSNTGIIAFGGRLLTLFERAAHAGPRALPPALAAAGGDACTAHPHVDPTTGRLVFFTYNMRTTGFDLAAGGPVMETCLTFWEVDEGWGVVARTPYTIGAYCLLHDFAMTENYYVVWQNPCYVDYAPMVLGRACAASCVRWRRGAPAALHLVPRPGSAAAAAGEAPRVHPAPPAFIFHHVNAFEEGGEEAEGGEREEGARSRRRSPPSSSSPSSSSPSSSAERSCGGGRRVVVDSIHYRGLPAVGRQALEAQQLEDVDAGFESRLRRMTVELDAPGAPPSATTAWEAYMEMPALDDRRLGRRHRHCYGYSSNFEAASIALVKVDMEGEAVDKWEPGPRVFCQEPEFVPRPGGTDDDDGWILSLAFNSETLASELLLLDARHLAAGPVARLALPHAIPHSLHGVWAPGEDDTGGALPT